MNFVPLFPIDSKSETLMTHFIKKWSDKLRKELFKAKGDEMTEKVTDGREKEIDDNETKIVNESSDQQHNAHIHEENDETKYMFKKTAIWAFDVFFKISLSFLFNFHFSFSILF